VRLGRDFHDLLVATKVTAVNGSVSVMATTVIQGPPNDPLDEFRSLALPAWERRGDYGDIIYEVAEGIARITINRPEVRNAFRPQTLFELSRAFEQARDDLTVGVEMTMLPTVALVASTSSISRYRFADSPNQ
jgi:hypothetical protein